MSEQDFNNLPDYEEDSFEVLEGLEPIRRDPTMYLNSVGLSGIRQLAIEAIDNVVDESKALAGYRKVNCKIEFFPDGSCRVSDNGRGIPVGLHPKKQIPTVYIAFEFIHGGSKLQGNTKSTYKGVIGTHGVGMSAVNAVSRFLNVEVKRDGKRYEIEYQKGKRIKDLTAVEEISENDTGTSVHFLYDDEILSPHSEEYGEMDYPFVIEDIRKALVDYVTFNDNIEFELIWDTGLEGDNEQGHEVFSKDNPNYNPYTLIEAVTMENTEVITLEHEDEKGVYSVKVLYSFAPKYGDTYRVSAVNGLKMRQGGTHEEAFKAEVYNFFERLLRQKGTLNDKVYLSQSDVIERLNYVVELSTDKKDYRGQVKDYFDNTVIAYSLREFFAQELLNMDSSLVTIILMSIENEYNNKVAMKEAWEKEQEKKIPRMKKTERDDILIGNFVDCENGDKLRNINVCYFTEGKSASNNLAQLRDITYMAYSTLEGKPLNVNKRSRALDKKDKKSIVNSNQFKLVQAIVALNKFGKLIILTDADIDGLHIRTLMIVLIMEYFPQIIDREQLYILEAPLYKMVKGNDTVFCYSDEEMEEYRSKGYDSTRFKGLGEMGLDDFEETVIKNPRMILVSGETLDRFIEGGEEYEITERELVRRLTSKDSSARKQLMMDLIAPEMRDYLENKRKIKRSLESKVNPLLVDSDGVPLTQDEVDLILYNDDTLYDEVLG